MDGSIARWRAAAAAIVTMTARAETLSARRIAGANDPHPRARNSIDSQEWPKALHIYSLAARRAGGQGSTRMSGRHELSTRRPYPLHATQSQY